MTAPGWYRDPTGEPLMRWWDGNRWTSASFAVPGGVNAQLRVLVQVLVGGLVLAGIVCSLQSVSVLSGMGIVWIGMCACVLAFGLCFVPNIMHFGVTIAVGVIAALAIGNAVYDYHQLDVKRSQIQQILNG